VDADGDGLHDLEEARLGTDPRDDDSDDDGLRDGQEPNAWDDHDGDGLLNALDSDSDGDALLDGVEAGVTEPAAGTDLATFRADADPNTRTGELLADTDGDGFPDGDEDANGNGRLDGGESDPLDPRDPEQIRCDFDFQCTEALGDGFYCDTDARACVEGERPPECTSDQDCEVAFGEGFACLEGRCERAPDEPDPDNNGEEPGNNDNNGAPPVAGDSGVADEGCGCALAPAPSPGGAWWLLLALAPLARPRRRR
jgi:MYXO-CTERM domain-containing protein